MLPLSDINSLYQAVFDVAFAIWCIPELLGFVFQRSPRDGTVRDRGSRLVVLGLIWIGIFADFWLSHGLRSAAIPWLRVPLFWLGCALLVAGTAFRWYSIRLLGRYFTRDVVIHPGQQVIQSGPYRLIRHPSYAGGLMSMLGLGLALGNWAGLVAVIGLMFGGYLYRMSIEERALLEGIGEPYREYMSRTRRLIPFVY